MSRGPKTPEDISSLRAISWVFALTQNRFLLPSWYGVGTAFSERVKAEGGLELLREMYAGWPFLKTLVDLMQLTLAKSDMRIAEAYTALVEDEGVRKRVWARVSEEHAACAGRCCGLPRRITSSTTTRSCNGPSGCVTRTWTRSPTYRWTSSSGSAPCRRTRPSARRWCIPCS